MSVAVTSFRYLIVVLSLCLAMPGSRLLAQAMVEESDNFSRKSVIERARQLSQEPFKSLPQAPKVLSNLDYSDYRKINYQQDAAVWGRSPTRFSIQLFAPGFLYRDLVDINIVENGKSSPLIVSEDSFRVPDPALAKILAEVGKYAGMRLHYPLNSEDYADEFLVFQGASYFRGVSKSQLYGLSARGLAIDVAGPQGEEHPIFRQFWVERPSSSHDSMVVHALLDSERVTGAYRFGIYPGSPLRMDVEVTLFPREDIEHVGLAPLTSMFMHGPLDPADLRDYRPAVHDSGGLAIKRGNGEHIWRPLANPRHLQISAFVDENPEGFGLIQRHRDFGYFQDLEASYHRRPSAWVQPLGDWGKGHVQLVEIPSDSEANDNIVAYWRPDQGLRQGQPFEYAYRLSWPDDVPGKADTARVVRSAGGEKLFSDHHEVMIDYGNLAVDNLEDIVAHAAIQPGRILESRVQPNPAINGIRVFLSLENSEEPVAEMRVDLKRGDEPVAETWLYRWLNE
ncbi:glucan biosynthesis protein G [Kineobactrum salinum]|uniref:Glucan biosynthesis protein G n=1 Tax=Kineobactrum salinum TaxID=2708301 RepID=A0A6C0U6Y9_9GAMM|nr:glucan biosynthesis protein G [Kineobactrum salinum]QIB66717.1 glucan biosynthesis protein G [Kineobactrum salinum]